MFWGQQSTIYIPDVWDLQDPEGRETGCMMGHCTRQRQKDLQCHHSAVAEHAFKQGHCIHFKNITAIVMLHYTSRVICKVISAYIRTSTGKEIIRSAQHWRSWYICERNGKDISNLCNLCVCAKHICSHSRFDPTLFLGLIFFYSALLAHIPHKCSPIIPHLNLPQEKRMALLRFVFLFHFLLNNVQCPNSGHLHKY